MTLDVDEICDEVVESLVEEEGIKKEKAEELVDEAVEEIDAGDADKMSAFSYLEARYENLVETAGSIKDLFVNWKTTRAEVKSVERFGSDDVKITVDHARFNGVESFLLDHDSDVLANLMLYKNADNPKDLEGCDLLVLPDSFDSYNITVLVPHNVSVTGQLRFKLYSLIREAHQKTRISVISDSDRSGFDGLLELTILSAFNAIILAIVRPASELLSGILMTPLAICLFILSFVVVYGLSRLALWITAALLRSDFEKL